jgi:hypothetical protein
MAAVAEHRGPSSQGHYRVLLANFEASYKSMKACSEEFAQVLREVRSPQSSEDRKARLENARTAYDEAQLRCVNATAKLQEHVIRESVSLGPGGSRVQLRDCVFDRDAEKV